MTSPSDRGFDLNVYQNKDFPLGPKSITYFSEMGYSTIALNTLVEEYVDEPKKKKQKSTSKAKQDFIPLPPEIPVNMEIITKILTRITIEMSDSSIVHKINQSENIKKYDLIAVKPKTLQAFQYVCNSMDIDIITFPHESKLQYKLNRKLYRQAVDRGICFELTYSPAIRDSSSRRNIINLGHLYSTIGKSRNLIVSSGAENVMQVRSLQDVMNLGFIFGLNTQQCKETVLTNPKKVLIKSDGRRRGKYYLHIKKNEAI